MNPPVKCLVVDDVEENLVAFSAALRSEDVEVLTARSARTALELLLLHEVALALIDVHMPDMDGIELAEIIRGSERTRRVPLIFVTAGSRDQYRQFKGYESGAVDFLYKPIEPHILKSKAEVFFQLYRQQAQLTQELREHSEMLRLSEMFTAVLGHDLRNPLDAIVTSAHLLQMQTQDAAVKETAGRILSSGRRMARLIQDMLDLARARLAGGIPVRHEPLDLQGLIERVVREQRSAYPSREIAVLHRGDLHGEWDSERLAQVASNLLGNALRYGDERVPIEVDLEGERAERVSLTIVNGGTIAPQLLPHLFDPFRGNERRHGRHEGLGLGLYIVQQIVRAHGGQVEVRSGSEDRTQFRVTIPRRPCEPWTTAPGSADA
jgi:two-component system, sensor histidine kinase and response regulator